MTTARLGSTPLGRRAQTKLGEYLPAAVVFVLAISVWEAAVFGFNIQFYLLPAPHVIVQAFRDQAALLVERYVVGRQDIGRLGDPLQLDHVDGHVPAVLVPGHP